ncbi:dTMP kinase [Aerococcus kribbianus]|uniref:Thymidylate kinase n=1 Tax=Aerococcus kribbianus TaxID=2999064 RepID=A0A9X3JH39_9LACT|nr:MULTISPECIES: dTMP kinase [unclassified Aerococcus]MCZ0717907.1 dTMP kinase [Aerococcus sp. YH-aer221]MCZ0726194.1 dTMP kinase [Aerococcus sp. YH-aer222]
MSYFITVEGPDGAGKTTLIQGLVDRLQADLQVPLLLTREPGGEPLAEKIRGVILDPKHTDLDPRAEALLYAASRRQHLVNKILPALAAGKMVLCDRYVDSSIAYQGYGREIGAQGVAAINEFAIEGKLPDMTLYLDLSAQEGIDRIQANREEAQQNRLDKEAIDFHERVVAGYQIINAQAGDRLVKIDASQSPDRMQAQALVAIKARFPQCFKND